MKTKLEFGALLRALAMVPVSLLGGAYAAGAGEIPSLSSTPSATAPVSLGSAHDFVILSETGISDVPASAVTGNVGTSPITGAADLLSCSEVTGKIYSVDDAGPTPCNIKAVNKLTHAVGDMQSAYTDAAARTPTILELGAGNIGGLVLAPGVYSWTTDVTIPANVALKGTKNDVWIFQTSKNLNVSAGQAVLLRGHAKAHNIFWQVAGTVTLGTTAHIEGVVLSKTQITMKTGSSINGRLLAQTAVTLQMSTVTVP